MSEIPLWILFIVLVALICASAFFSGSETALMAINRYRLRHQAQIGNRGALRVSQLLKRSDRLIGLILLGNNFINVVITSLATIIAIRLVGEAGVPIGAVILTIVLLIFGEVTPKTLAAKHPERFAYPASVILIPLLKVFSPLVRALTAVTSLMLKLLGVNPESKAQHSLNPAELRTAVLESSGVLPVEHRDMLLSILDLEAVTVDDIMVPRAAIEGIDLESDWNEILNQLRRSQYTRLPVYRGEIDNVVGLLHFRAVAGALQDIDTFNRATLESLVDDPYFIAEGTPLQTQLLNFQAEQQRVGLVVDEYGDIQGLATLEDILEEIVGEFTTDPSVQSRHAIIAQSDGSYLVDGSAPIRSLNRSLGWDLPTSGPKTLNGVIMEYLETIPVAGTSVLLANRPVEIVKLAGNRVKTAVVRPAINSEANGNSAQ